MSPLRLPFHVDRAWAYRLCFVLGVSAMALWPGARGRSPVVEATGAATDSPEPYECGDVERIHTVGKIFLASQPTPSDLKKAKKGGIETVINLRHPKETEFDEKKVVASLGMKYVNLPWNGPEELTPKIFRKARKLLRESEKPILLHCSSANRVGAVWIPYRALDAGVSLERAVHEAKTIGLKTPAYEEKARRYVERIRPDTSGSYDDPISPVVQGNVRVVYQIKTDATKDGIAAGLHYLDKLVRVYDGLRIMAKDRRVVGVFHGDAGHFLLKDAAYESASGKSGGNPNESMVRELLDSGVQLELCKSTMRSRGWKGADVLPGVRIVTGAYPRIIDLQLRGFAYIRF